MPMNMSYLLHFRELLRGSINPIDDTVDKINRRYSVLLFMSLSIPLMTKQFVGDPIQCFTPTYFTEAQTKYVNSFCWTTSTYYLVEDLPKFGTIHLSGHDGFSESHESLRSGPGVDNRVKVSYYQWTVTILVFQGFTFYIPFVFWRTFANANGVNLPKLLIQLCCAWDHMAEDPERLSMMKNIVAEVRKLLGFRPRKAPSTFRECLAQGYWCFGHRLGLTGVYLTMKIMYACLPLAHLSMLTSLFGSEYLTCGFRILREGFGKEQLKNFPLQTLCQVSAAQQGSLRIYQCQCVLPVNLYNEKIFTCIWFYLVGLSIVNFASFGTWVYCLSSRKKATVISYMKCLEERAASEDEQQQSREADYPSIQALSEFLDFDGILFLRLAEVNSGVLASEDVFKRLWKGLHNMQRASKLKTTVTDVESDEFTADEPTTTSLSTPSPRPQRLRIVENGDVPRRSLSPGGLSSRHRLDMDLAIISAFGRRSPIGPRLPLHWRTRRRSEQVAARSSSRSRF